MSRFKIKRIAENSDNAYGVFIDGDTPFAVTLELPWRHNIQNKSCVFPGTYRCIKKKFGKYIGLWELQNVGGRTGIILHNGVVNIHTLGCILVAEQYERFWYKDKWWDGVLQSKKGLAEFMKKTEGLYVLEIDIIDNTGIKRHWE